MAFPCTDTFWFTRVLALKSLPECSYTYWNREAVYFCVGDIWLVPISLSGIVRCRDAVHACLHSMIDRRLSCLAWRRGVTVPAMV